MDPLELGVTVLGAFGAAIGAMELVLNDPHLVTQDHKLDVLVSSAKPRRGHQR